MTDGTYNVTGGTASAYYSSVPVDYNLPYFRYFNYNENSSYDEYIKLLESNVSSMNMSELISTTKLCKSTIKNATVYLGSFDEQSQGDVPLWSMIDFQSFLRINEVADVLIQKWTEASIRLSGMNVTGYPDVNETIPRRLDNTLLDGQYDVRYDYLRFVEESYVYFSRFLIRTEPGNYDSTKVIAPIGNFTVEFETRSLEEFDVKHEIITIEVGSGKNYHTEKFRVSKLIMQDHDIHASNYTTMTLQISVAQYIGPSKYEATNPFDGYDAVISKNYELLSAHTTQVDGHSASLYESYNTKNNNLPDKYAVVYDFNTGTTKNFVLVETYMANYDKDVSLWIETLHIEKNNTNGL
jgi:hypothetical protein